MERWSFEVGKRLENDPPYNTDVKYFRPPVIGRGYFMSGQKEMARMDRAGNIERKKYVRTNYHASTFVIDLHDTPLYAAEEGGFRERKRNGKFKIIYADKNPRLHSVLEKYKVENPWNNDVKMIPHYPRYFASRNHVGIESLPSVLLKDGHFDTISVYEGERFVRHFVDYIQNNYGNGHSTAIKEFS